MGLLICIPGENVLGAVGNSFRGRNCFLLCLLLIIHCQGEVVSGAVECCGGFIGGLRREQREQY